MADLQDLIYPATATLPLNIKDEFVKESNITLRDFSVET